MLFSALLTTLNPQPITLSWQKSQQQKEHAEQPTDRLPHISPSRFPVVRRCQPKRKSPWKQMTSRVKEFSE